MEWDVTNEGNKPKNLILTQRLLNHLDGAKFRVKEMVYVGNNFEDETKPVEQTCFMDDLVRLWSIGLQVSSRNLVPVVSYDFLECTERYGGKPISNQPELHKSQDIDDCVTMDHLTECGHWTHRIIKEVKNEVVDFFGLKSEKCGLDYLCKRCADPFEYWYCQNLPRRLLHEPFWDGIIWFTLQTEQERERETRVLKLKLARDEKEKGRIQKGKKIQKTSASWGFRQAPIEDIVFDNKKNHEKKNKKKIKKLIKKGVVVKGSEDVKTPESFEEKEDNLFLEDAVLKNSEDNVKTSESPKIDVEEEDVKIPKYLEVVEEEGEMEHPKDGDSYK